MATGGRKGNKLHFYMYCQAVGARYSEVGLLISRIPYRCGASEVSIGTRSSQPSAKHMLRGIHGDLRLTL